MVKKFIRILAGLILFYLFAGPSPSRAEEYAYDGHGKRDPFVPLVGVTSKTAESLEDIMSVDEVKIQGVASDSTGRKAAIINGEMIREGKTVGHLTVKKILKNEIIITIDEEEHRLNIYEEKGGQNEQNE